MSPTRVHDRVFIMHVRQMCVFGSTSPCKLEHHHPRSTDLFPAQGCQRTFKDLNMVNKVRVESIVNGVERNMGMETRAVPSVLAANTSHAEASETCTERTAPEHTHILDCNAISSDRTY